MEQELFKIKQTFDRKDLKLGSNPKLNEQVVYTARFPRDFQARYHYM